VVLPEALDPRVLKAAAELSARGLAKVVLLGEPDRVAAQARKLNVDISEVHQRGPGGPKRDILCLSRRTAWLRGRASSTPPFLVCASGPSGVET